VVWSDGTRDAVDIAGVLDVRVAIDVKGRTTAAQGVEQLRVLKARGARGYAQIGGQLWLLNYEPSKVVHLLIAPEGADLARAAKAAEELTRAGALSKVIAIPKALDDEVIDLGRAYLEAALATPR